MGPWGSLVSLRASGVRDPGANPGGPISFINRFFFKERW